VACFRVKFTLTFITIFVGWGAGKFWGGVKMCSLRLIKWTALRVTGKCVLKCVLLSFGVFEKFFVASKYLAGA
jgi:hypothetical protein